MKVLNSRCVSSKTSLLPSQETAPMTPWQNRVTDLTRRMADDMKVRNYSQRTIDAYTYHVGKFADFLGKSPLEATAEDVRSFQQGQRP